MTSKEWLELVKQHGGETAWKYANEAVAVATDDADRSKTVYVGALRYIHDMCDAAGVPAGDETLRVGWLIKKAGLRLPPPDDVKLGETPGVEVEGE